MRFGEIIREYRVKRGWTQADLIEKMGADFTTSYLSKIEVRGELPRPEIIALLAYKLGIDKEFITSVARKEFIDNYKEKLDRIYIEAMEKHGRTWNPRSESEESEGAVQLDSVRSDGT